MVCRFYLVYLKVVGIVKMYRLFFFIPLGSLAYFSLFINVSTCYFGFFSSVHKLFKEITSSEINEVIIFNKEHMMQSREGCRQTN